MQRPAHLAVHSSVQTKTPAPKDGRRYGVEIDPNFRHAIRKQKDGNEDGKAAAGKGTIVEKEK